MAVNEVEIKSKPIFTILANLCIILTRQTVPSTLKAIIWFSFPVEIRLAFFLTKFCRVKKIEWVTVMANPCGVVASHAKL